MSRNITRRRLFEAVAGAGAAFSLTCTRAAVEKPAPGAPPWKAGVGRIRITAEKSLWMGGFGARTKPSEGILHELYAKALALDDGSRQPAVLVTTDIVGFRAAVAQNIAERVEKQYGLLRARLAEFLPHALWAAAG